jgi:hypothetical protein
MASPADKQTLAAHKQTLADKLGGVVTTIVQLPHVLHADSSKQVGAHVVISRRARMRHDAAGRLQTRRRSAAQVSQAIKDLSARERTLQRPREVGGCLALLLQLLQQALLHGAIAPACGCPTHPGGAAHRWPPFRLQIVDALPKELSVVDQHLDQALTRSVQAVGHVPALPSSSSLDPRSATHPSIAYNASRAGRCLQGLRHTSQPGRARALQQCPPAAALMLL